MNSYNLTRVLERESESVKERERDIGRKREGEEKERQKREKGFLRSKNSKKFKWEYFIIE